MPRNPTHRLSLSGQVLAVAALALLFLAGFCLWRWSAPDVFFGVPDPDVWLRLLRVDHLHSGGGWYDRTFNRLSAPEGLESHWTRPFDVFLLALAWPASLFVPYREALLFAAVACNVVLWWLGVAGALALCRALGVQKAGLWMAGLFMLTNGFIGGLYLMGRADHHSLLLTIFIWMLALLAGFRESGASRRLYGAGLLTGLGLWDAPEFILVIALVVVWLGLCWLRGGDTARLREARRFLMAALAVATVGVMLEWSPHAWLTVSHSRLSVLHLHIIAVVLLGVVALAACSRRLPSLPARAVAAALAGGAALAWLQSVYPRFYEGPMAETSREMVSVFSWQFSELRSMPELYGVPGAVCLALFFAVALATYGDALRRSQRPAVGLLLLAVALYAGLTAAVVRFGGFAAAACLPAWAMLADRAQARLVRLPALAGQPPRVALLAALLLLLLSQYALFVPASRQAEGMASSSCMAELTRMIEAGRISEAAGLRAPTVVLTHRDVVGQLLFWTPHGAIASNYNNNEEGIRDLERFLFAQDAVAALDVVRRRGVGLIVLCMDVADTPFFPVDPPLKPLFLRRAAEGKLPGWLKRVEGDFPKDMLFLKVKSAI